MRSPAVGCDVVEEQRARWERKRCRAAGQLVETEQRYLEHLALVVTYFVAILRAKGTLKPAVQEAIFGSMESIHLASQNLLLHLQGGHLVLGLESFCHQLELYVCYAENLEQARSTLEKQLRKNKSFSHFKKLQESRPEFKGYRLEDLLLLPLQRLHHGIHGQILSLFSCGHQVLALAVRASTARFLDGQSAPGDCPHPASFLLLPGRWYLQEGWLMVVPCKGGEVQRRMFFLFSDVLLVTKPCHPLHPWNSHKFACEAIYPLSQCTVGKVFGHTRSQGGLLSLSFSHAKLLLMSHDQEDFNTWTQNLEAAVR
uniref:Rho guanine nucleotide exchange factor 39 n=1 Tax=Varanus komodoensis TaxID=61221 RepID=A0A8D2KWM9_VARKO